MDARRVRVWTALVILIGLLAPAMLRPIGASAAPAKKAQTYFTCVWHGQTVRLKHVAKSPVERNKDAVLAGQCQNFQTNDKYYGRLVKKSINVFVAWREFPGVFVVHNSLQGRQPVYGSWTFPIGISQPGTLDGTVTDSVTGQPVSDATITAQQCTGAPKQCITHTGYTAADGTYAVQFYYPGKYTVYAGAPGYATSKKSTVTIYSGRGSTMNFGLTQQASATTLTVSAAPNPVTLNQSVTLTATVNQTVSDGVVTFTGVGPGGATFSSATCTPVSGTCTIPWTASAAGTWTVTAVWSGDSLYKGSTGNVQVVVTGAQPQPTSMTLAVSPVSPGLSQAATVTATFSQPVSGGTVSFTGTGPNGATFSPQACTPANGTCSISWTPTSAGQYAITASWSGNSQYLATTASTSVTVASAISLNLTAAASTTNSQAVNLTATLSVPVNDGLVTFSGTGPNTATFTAQTCVPSNGSCTVTWTPSALGTWSVTASWSGDGTYPSVSKTIQLQVAGGTATVALSVTPTQPALGQTSTVRATLTVPANDGLISFTGTGPGGASFPSQFCTPISGTCAVSWSPAAAGSWSITATWSGDTQYPNGASTTSNVTVGTSGTLTLTYTPNPASVNQTVTVTANVGQTVSGGTVTFTGTTPNGGTISQQTCTVTNGTCAVTFSPPLAGTYTLTANYSGSGSVAPSSNTLTINVGSGSVLSLSNNPTPAAVGSTSTLTATVGGGNSGGDVQVTFNGPSGTVYTRDCTPDPTSCTITWSPSYTGTWTLQGSYISGGTTVAQSTLTVSAGGNVNMTLTETPNPLTLGNTGTLIANLNQSAIGSGTVSFTAVGPNNATLTPAACTPTNGTCTSNFTPTTTGSWTVTANYSGSGSYTGAQATTTVTVNSSSGGTGNITLSNNPTTGTVNQQETTTASLPATSGNYTVNFTFTDNQGHTASPTSCQTVNGNCAVTWTPTTAGTWTVTASWTGGGGFTGTSSTSTVTVQSSGGNNGSLTVSVTPTQPVHGNPASLVVNLGVNVTDGDVSFYVTDPNGNSVTVPDCAPVNGTCSSTFTPTSAGQYTVLAYWTPSSSSTYSSEFGYDYVNVV